MGRNLYILASTLILFGLISCGIAYTNIGNTPRSTPPRPKDRPTYR